MPYEEGRPKRCALRYALNEEDGRLTGGKGGCADRYKGKSGDLDSRLTLDRRAETNERDRLVRTTLPKYPIVRRT